MKVHSTNYEDTFITIADDCPTVEGTVPPLKGDKKSVANLQYEMIKDQPYKYTSDDVLFGVYAMRNDISETEMEAERQKFFSKGQPCFRASPLTKRYGWGVHSDADGKIALFGAETEAYEKFTSAKDVISVQAMRSKRR